MPVTLADVARQAAVSVATASRVLNGSTRTVRCDLQQRVLQAARELHYVANANAQALVNERSAIIGVIVHGVSDPYFAEIAQGVQDAASDAQRLVMVCDSGRENRRLLEYIRLLHAQRVDAIILAGSGTLDDSFNTELQQQLDIFHQSGGRVAFIGRHCMSGPTICADNYSGGQAVGRLLYELGHRRIGILDGPALTSTKDRCQGFCDALAGFGLHVDPAHIVQGHFSTEGGIAAAGLLLDRAPDLTALFALNDLMAIGALKALRQRDIAVPGQVSVAGFDDIPFASVCVPSLTSVQMPMVQLGRIAVELALAQPDAESSTRCLPTALVVRESVAAPPY